MSIGAALYSILTGDSAVAALVSTRVYPGLLPDKQSMPAISYAREDDRRHQGLSGYLGGSEATYEISCWSDSYSESESVGAAVIAALEDYSGTAAGVAIQHIYIIDSDDELHRSSANLALRRYGRIVTVSIFI